MSHVKARECKTFVLRVKSSAYRDGLQRIMLVAAAMLLIIGDNRFWMSIPTWMNGAGSLVAGGAILLAGVLLIANALREKTVLRAEPLLPVFAYLALLGIWARFGFDGSTIADRDLAIALPMYAILCLSREDKIRLLYSVGMVFSIAMGFAAVFFLMRYAGASFPFFTLEPSNPLKTAQGMHYEISVLGGVLLNRYGNLSFCGVFDEAGCAGTFAALLYIAVGECKAVDDFRHARAMKIALLAEGALSFSFAFLLLMAAYLAFRLLRNGDVKTAGVVVALLVTMLLIMFVDLQQLGAFGSLQTRVKALFSGEGILNNRVNAQTDTIMRGFYTTSSSSISLFGFGKSAFNTIAAAAGVDGCSVVFYLYDYGYIGTALYYIVIVILNRCSGRSLAGCWIPLILFLISTYQRPEVMTSLYLTILMLSFIPTVKSENRFVEKTSIRSTSAHLAAMR